MTIDHNKTIEDIIKYSSFQDNWDGEGSKIAPEAEFKNALLLLELLPNSCSQLIPMISYNGTVGLYCDDKTIYMDFEINSNNTFSFFARNRINSKESFLDDIPINEQCGKIIEEQLALIIE
jgi:hypothetical protein